MAWTWTNCLAYAGTAQEAKEQELKTFFIEHLQKQALSTHVYVNCGAPDALGQAEQCSQDIQNMLLGKNNEVEYLQSNKITITLSDVVEKLTGEDLITTKDRSFGEMFVIKVIVEFAGSIGYSPGKNENSPNKNKYLLELSYPPCPVLGPATITEQTLYNWVNNSTPGSSYLPPSAYLPWAAT